MLHSVSKFHNFCSNYPLIILFKAVATSVFLLQINTFVTISSGLKPGDGILVLYQVICDLIILIPLPMCLPSTNQNALSTLLHPVIGSVTKWFPSVPCPMQLDSLVYACCTLQCPLLVFEVLQLYSDALTVSSSPLFVSHFVQ